MREKMRRWLADHPRALNAAFGLTTTFGVAFGFGIDLNAGGGGMFGP